MKKDRGYDAGGQLERVIMLADAQSFYASIEKASYPEYREKPLVVSGDPERRSGIILAACPIAKSYGITTAETLREALNKCPELVVIRPRMEHYIQTSLLITEILESFSDLVEPYSIDEQFVDVTGSQQLFGSPERMAKAMQDKVWSETGVYIRIGISDCKVLAKMACDLWAKKNADGIFWLKRHDLPATLWKQPIERLFMVGSRMTQHFRSMGLITIGQLARTELPQLKAMMKRKLRRNCEIDAEVYWRIANGIDDSPVYPQTHEGQKGIGHQMTLPRDYYTFEEIKVVLLELSELVCQRCRAKGQMGWVVSVGCQGADFDRPSGFYRQAKLSDPTNVTNQVYRRAKALFQQHWDGLPVRKLGVTLSELISDQVYQLSLFDERESYMALEKTTDALKRRFGDTAVMRAVSLTKAGQARDRARKIGGHYK